MSGITGITGSKYHFACFYWCAVILFYLNWVLLCLRISVFLLVYWCVSIWFVCTVHEAHRVLVGATWTAGRGKTLPLSVTSAWKRGVLCWQLTAVFFVGLVGPWLTADWASETAGCRGRPPSRMSQSPPSPYSSPSGKTLNPRKLLILILVFWA